MNEREVGSHDVTVVVGSISPEAPFAGTEMAVTVGVSCSEGCDLLGRELAIVDRDGATLHGITLTASHVGPDGAHTVLVSTPATAGPHAWSVRFPHQEVDGAPHGPASAELSFDVAPHPASVVVWGVPSAIETGASFAIKVGIKCPHGCDLTGRPFEVTDGVSKRLAAGAVGAEPYSGTKALHFAEVDLAAPTAVGQERWTVRFADVSEPLPHAEGSRSFGFTTVEPPQHTVTVRAVDKEKQAPVRGAHVLLHPFRATTDEQGIARVRVSQGQYQLFVSGFDYYTVQSPLEVTDDVEQTVELVVEPVPTGDEHY